MALKMITLGFGNPQVLEQTFSLIDETRTLDIPWYILNNHYPLPSKSEVDSWLKANASKYKYSVLDAGKNLGLHGGINWLDAQVFNAGDHMLAVDPDTLPGSKGWDEAMWAAAQDSRNVWVSAFNNHSWGEMCERGYMEEPPLIIPKAPVCNSICLWSIDWLRDCGGLQEPSKWYGGLEMCMWRFLDQKSKRWVFTRDAFEESSLSYPNYGDLKYREYKFEHAHKGYPHSFEEFLQGKPF